MGINDSSIYRVLPTVLYVGDDLNKIKKLLELVGCNKDIGSRIDKVMYGKNEKLLLPLKEILKNALYYYRLPKNYDNNNETWKNREQLINGEVQISEAKDLIEMYYDKINTINPPKHNDRWYIVEGCSQPDVFIETDKCIIVIEGKWTEGKITNEVNNLSCFRNQMVRHIQGTINYNNRFCDGKKEIIAFYIVDEEISKPYQKDLTKEGFKVIVSNEKLECEYNNYLSDYYYGYTTWQNINSIFDDKITFLTKEEIETIIKNRMIELNNYLNLGINNLDLLSKATAVRPVPRYGGKNHKEYENDCLATLGDAVLKLIISEGLYKKEGIDSADEITNKKAELENNKKFKEISDNHLVNYEHIYALFYNTDKDKIDFTNKGHNSNFEAIVGAKFLDSDYNSTKDWVISFYRDKLNIEL